MEFKNFFVKKEEKLSELAARLGVSEEKIKELNPNLKTTGGLLMGGAFVTINQSIKIPDKEQTEKVRLAQKNQKLSEEKELLSGISFDQQARYRCEKKHITKINGVGVNHSTIKQEFLVQTNRSESLFTSNLTDSYYEFSPKKLETAFEVISETEKIRNNVVLKLDESGKPAEILNEIEQQNLWINFRNNGLDQSQLIRKLKENNREAYHNIINEGNKQFSGKNAAHFKSYLNDPFYYIFLGHHLVSDEWKNVVEDTLLFQSLIIPNLPINLKMIRTHISESNSIHTMRKVSELNLLPEDLDTIKSEYDKLYKPRIHYNFTDYNLTLRIRYYVNDKTRMLEEATFAVIEEIKNNVESVMEFKIKKVKT